MNIDRKRAWSSIKSAVRSYAKDPTVMTAEQVEQAWAEMRRIDNLEQWREWRARSNAKSTESAGERFRQR